MIIALYIALAGALGTLSRYGMSVGAQRLLGDRYPYGTFAVNVLGSFALGVIMAAVASRSAIDSQLRLALTIGFLGGFTTYSSFAYETVILLEDRRVAAAAAYVVLTVVVAALACAGGMVTARALFGR